MVRRGGQKSEMDAVSHRGKAIRVGNIIIEQNSGRAGTFTFHFFKISDDVVGTNFGLSSPLRELCILHLHQSWFSPWSRDSPVRVVTSILLRS